MKSSLKQRSVSSSASLAVLNGKTGSLFFLVLALCFLFITFVRPAILTAPRIGVSDIFTPVISVVSKPFQNMAEAVSGISDKATLKAENAKLKSENARLREWYQTALMLQAENQSLQKLLNLKVHTDHKYVTARVVSDAGNTFVKTLLVSSGSKNGVQKNQAVLSGEGMIGRVIEVGHNAARILLLSDINSRIPVLIEGTNQKAILVGNNSDLLSLSHLAKDSGLVDGMRIITSGDGGVFPLGLPIGKIMTNASGEKVIKPFADMRRITYVRVVDTPSNPNLIRGDLSSSAQ